MNFIEYTEQVIEKCLTENPSARMLVIGPGYHINHPNVVVPDAGPDLAQWCEEYRNSPEFLTFDFIIMCRVFEHLPIRQIDYYLYVLSTLLKMEGKLICTVPQMDLIAEQLTKEYARQKPDLFKIKRLNFELFNEGDNIRDRHSFWTSKRAMYDLLEDEGLFEIDIITEVQLDTAIVPAAIEVIATRI